jgi:DNA-binding MarR family transcriptional regulator
MKRQPTCICVNLRRAARAISSIYDEALTTSGIKITQFSLLRAVERHEPIAVSALAEEMELERTTMARNLIPLERDGLITLTVGEDQRVTEVRLTKAGGAAIAKALPLWESAQAEISRLLTHGRIAQLGKIAEETFAAASQLKIKAQNRVSATASRRRAR